MKKMFLVTFSLFILFTLPADSGFKEIEESGFTLKWKVEGEQVRFIVSAETEGWIAVGFDPGIIMKDADMIVGYVKNGRVYLEDQFGSGMFSHRRDVDLGGSDDILEKSGDESAGVTRLEFLLPLNSGDRFDKVLRQGRRLSIIFAFSTSDDTGRKHSRVAKTTITL